MLISPVSGFGRAVPGFKRSDCFGVKVFTVSVAAKIVYCCFYVFGKFLHFLKISFGKSCRFCN